MNHEDFINKLDGIIGKKQQKSRQRDFLKEFHARRRTLVRFVCDITNIPGTITGKVLFAKDEEALLLKVEKIYRKEVVVKIISQETIWDSNNQ